MLNELCKEPGPGPYNIEDAGSNFEIWQIVGSTRRTDFFYILEEGTLVNIRYVRGARLVSREERARGRTVETYRISKENLAGKEVVIISFTRSGSMSVELCRINGAIQCYLCEKSEELAKSLVPMFKLFGDEKPFLDHYLEYVPRLVDDIKRVMNISGAEIFFAGRARRTEEVLENPYISLISSMALDTQRGRALSLQEKLSRIAELWITSMVIDAIDGETFGKRYWWVEYIRNSPFAYVKSRIQSNKEYTIFYQPSIYPHIMGFFTGKRHHLIPDIVVFKGIIAGTSPGRLHELASISKPALLIEVKTGLETAKWRNPEYVLGQLKEYRELLKPEHMALAALLRTDPELSLEVSKLGVNVFENVLNPRELERFKEYMRSVLLL